MVKDHFQTPFLKTFLGQLRRSGVNFFWNFYLILTIESELWLKNQILRYIFPGTRSLGQKGKPSLEGRGRLALSIEQWPKHSCQKLALHEFFRIRFCINSTVSIFLTSFICCLAKHRLLFKKWQSNSRQQVKKCGWKWIQRKQFYFWTIREM